MLALTSSIASLALLNLAAAAPAANVPAGKESSGNVYFSWKLTNKADGSALPANTQAKSLTFPLQINADTLRQPGTYLAQQYGFGGQSQIGYLGLQPRADSNGAQRLHAVFSSFVPGSKSTDSQCTDGADGGDGVSCAVEFNGVYGREYEITVQNIGGTTFQGTLTSAQGDNIHIGTYTLPSGTGGLLPSQVGFIEWYGGSPQWTVDAGKCKTELSKVDVRIGAVYSTDLNAYGAITNLYEQDDDNCSGSDSAFSDSQISFPFTLNGKSLHATGYTVTRGFVSN